MPVLADAGLIWIVFVIITVIAQVVKGAKKVSSQAPGGPNALPGDDDASRGDPVAPSDELRKFLEGLSGGAVRPSPPPVAQRPRAMPMPAAQGSRTAAQNPRCPTPPPTPRYQRQEQPPRRQKGQPRPPQPVEVAIPVPDNQTDTQDAVVLEILSQGDTPTRRLQQLIRQELQNADAVRKSIVLREVLGPCVAFKPYKWRA